MIEKSVMKRESTNETMRESDARKTEEIQTNRGGVVRVKGVMATMTLARSSTRETKSQLGAASGRSGLTQCRVPRSPTGATATMETGAGKGRRGTLPSLPQPTPVRGLGTAPYITHSIHPPDASAKSYTGRRF